MIPILPDDVFPQSILNLADTFGACGCDFPFQIEAKIGIADIYAPTVLIPIDARIFPN
jgi:hypothetical protein